MRKIAVIGEYVGQGIGLDTVKKLFADRGYQADQYYDFPGVDLTGYEAILVCMNQVTQEVLDKAPQVKVVEKYGVGIENIDQAACNSRGIKVVNLPGVNKEAVAEAVLGLMLAVSRKIVIGDKECRAGEWPRLVGTSMIGKTLGIVGTGNIGRTLASLASGFHMKLLGYDTYKTDAFTAIDGKYVELDELIREADFISIHAPLTPETHHMFSTEQFKAMKKTAVLVNAARGPLVDEAALYTALTTGEIAGTALDVYEQEPPEKDNPLFKLENAVVIPHIAASTDDTAKKMDTESVRVLCDTLDAM